MIQYCRYCVYLVTGNGTYCEAKNEERSDKSCKSANSCPKFEYCEIDAFDLSRTYRPYNGTSRRCPQKSNERQMSLWD